MRGVECSRACLSEMKKGYGQGTRGDRLSSVLLPLEPPTVAPPAAPPDSRAQTRVV
jgi:hypothetical protein